MKPTGWILTLIIAAALPGCLFAAPPTRTEVGWALGGGEPSRTRVATGAHLASIAPAESTRIDLGVGVLYESGDNTQMAPSTKGPYADVGVAVVRNRFARVFVGLRGERRWQAHEMHYGTKLRVDAEFFSHSSGPFSGAGECGVVSGAYAGNTGLGAYVEAGAAWLPGDPTWIATTGVTVRLPGFAGIAIGGGCGHGRDSGGSSGSSGSGWHPSGNH
ncbi:MAG TPA: hypothetical protein VL326_31325 [Kofleriaceae bacterium]|nr:hypothetical protein [Kofleriaceae bacterium]